MARRTCLPFPRNIYDQRHHAEIPHRTTMMLQGEMRRAIHLSTLTFQAASREKAHLMAAGTVNFHLLIANLQSLDRKAWSLLRETSRVLEIPAS